MKKCKLGLVFWEIWRHGNPIIAHGLQIWKRACTIVLELTDKKMMTNLRKCMKLYNKLDCCNAKCWIKVKGLIPRRENLGRCPTTRGSQYRQRKAAGIIKVLWSTVDTAENELIYSFISGLTIKILIIELKALRIGHLSELTTLKQLLYCQVGN